MDTLLIATLGGGVETRLKPERVQERLAAMAGWKLKPGGGSIERRVTFPGPQSAASYAHFLFELASAWGKTVRLAVNGGRVAITLGGGRIGLTESILDFAEKIS